MKKRRRLLTITWFFLAVVISTIIIFTNAFFEKTVPIKKVIFGLWPYLLISYFFLFLTYKLVEYYYLQLLNQKTVFEKLNSSFLKISSSIKVNEILKNALETIMDYCGANKGIFIISDEKVKKYSTSDVLTINNSSGDREMYYENYKMITFSSLSIKQEKIKKYIEEYEINKCNLVIVIPVFEKGTIVVGAKLNKKREKGDETLKIITDIFIEQLNTHLENAILHEEINQASITDPLTNLYNRRYFNERLKNEFSIARRKGFPVSVMISDLDDFKHYVDTYGHPNGDIILREVAKVVKLSLRETDIVCRFGGDEFAYILPFTPSIEAKGIAEIVKKNVSKFKFLENITKGGIHITLSMGIATFPEHGENEKDILSKANNALFKAKNMGKNKVIIYGE